jgi:hypothetical protein
MGDPHNPLRAGEKWNSDWLKHQYDEILHVAHFGVLSGGWAWHFMSPPHKEIKTLHDHKDIDLFAFPTTFSTLVDILYNRGFQKAKTLHDDPAKSFYRYTKYLNKRKIVFDIFVEAVPYFSKYVDIYNKINIIKPECLLTYYGKSHSSSQCIAVMAAKKLIEKGIDPIDHMELITYG